MRALFLAAVGAAAKPNGLSEEATDPSPAEASPTASTTKAPNVYVPPLIPKTLFLTSRFKDLTALPQAVQQNVVNLLNINSDLEMVWFDDTKCLALLEATPPLRDLFLSTSHGSHKSDICRTAYLIEHGGWYVDLDIDLAMPLTALAAPDTTFVSCWEAEAPGVFNAIMGTVPNSPVLTAARDWMLSPSQGCTGPENACGTEAVQEGMVAFARQTDSTALPPAKEGPAVAVVGGQKFKMLHEVNIFRPREWLASEKKAADAAQDLRPHSQIKFAGAAFAILDVASDKVVGFSRFDACAKFGCEQLAHKQEAPSAGRQMSLLELGAAADRAAAVLDALTFRPGMKLQVAAELGSLYAQLGEHVQGLVGRLGDVGKS